MPAIETVPCDVDVLCKLTVQITPFCPIKDEIDGYDVTVTWRTKNSHTFEKWSLKDYLKSYNGSEITQEDLTAKISQALEETAVVSHGVKLQDTEHMDMMTRTSLYE